jgi:putative selenate reductase
VLAMSLLERLSDALPGRLAIPGHDGPVMVSFSAGNTKENLAASLATGINPATICSDLLKPGGYGRLAPMLKALATAVKGDGAPSLSVWKSRQHDAATAAGFDNACRRHVADIRGDGVAPYHLDGNSKLPREVDNDLEMFGCVACNFCVTVCPNDAFTNIRSLEGMQGRQQYLLFSELCNECGNCLTFCPERGDPALIKPRLYTDRELYEQRDGQGFLIDDGRVIEARADDESIAAVQALLASDAGNPLG